MNLLQNRIFQNTILFFTWLFISPVYLFLSIRWKIPKIRMRIFYTIISPCTIILIFFMSWYSYDYLYYYTYRGRMFEIEAKTELVFPNYKVIMPRKMVEYNSFCKHRSSWSLFGDFSMDYTVQLDSTETNSFYKKLNQLVLYYDKTKKKRWKENSRFCKNWKYKNGYYIFYYYAEIDQSDALYLEINTKNGIMHIGYCD